MLCAFAARAESGHKLMITLYIRHTEQSHVHANAVGSWILALCWSSGSPVLSAKNRVRKNLLLLAIAAALNKHQSGIIQSQIDAPNRRSHMHPRSNPKKRSTLQTKRAQHAQSVATKSACEARRALRAARTGSVSALTETAVMYSSSAP